MPSISEQKHRDILRAARELFLESGFTSTGVDEIARRAGVSKRTLYNHFPTKEALFHEIVDEEKGKSFQLEPAYDPGRPLAEQLREVAEARQIPPERVRLLRMLIGEVLRTPELIRDVEAEMRRSDECLAPWLEAAEADGRMRVEDPKMASRLFWSGVTSYFWRRLVTGKDVITDDAWGPFVDEWITTFLARFAT
ncbi:MAG TPA: TetR/AcrR family transcriptional regulator [Polyangiaceae bacterium LLY-WYZ-15_(1-7)]|nr:hypothetical protein [Myxococcales bacterium]MAT27002.1 hypothetical protein [Sandaracinus sp.]HJK91821.1 TetR/AcrR family transcriptional regulator [Polyangiaceae bacterium LLY-WYZ-15_(1-7)]HJL06609.1 TetR/AcrR family transcriptional regulator [Polyangiaceae bacterium LLY-WYZ-15_(1-7)]HJL09215.1 TetR/AcrR family transcriptional regulator [Polyangiaceae bacterium LLY-WYZ-15_(1-7)]